MYNIRAKGPTMAGVPKSAIHAFFVRLLRPALRAMLRHGVNFRELSELLKSSCVAVATDEFGIDARPTNVSRVATLTDMTRRDVRRVRPRLDEEAQEMLGRMNSATRVLSGWYQDAEFLDDAGNPSPLPESGPLPSCTELATRYAGDIPVTTLSKELKNAGAMEIADDGRLTARTRYDLPGRTQPATAATTTRSGSVLADAGDTVDDNLRRRPEDATGFERRGTKLRISADTVGEFRDFIEPEGQASLEVVDAWLSDHDVAEVELDRHELIRLWLGAYRIEDEVRRGVPT